MYDVEEYLTGNLNRISKKLFEKRFNKDENSRTRVHLYKNIDEVMQAGLMAANAECEMIEKRIDSFAADLVQNFFLENDNSENIKKTIHWS